jgi:hypothetical protein
MLSSRTGYASRSRAGGTTTYCGHWTTSAPPKTTRIPAGPGSRPRAVEKQPDGRWLLENTHPGAVHFAMEDGNNGPSRWITLRALRVLNWYDDRPEVAGPQQTPAEDSDN